MTLCSLHRQIVLKREYTYARTVTMKNPDGSETMRTMKLKTPHDETHIVYAAVH
jgi:hypothetical protein